MVCGYADSRETPHCHLPTSDGTGPAHIRSQLRDHFFGQNPNGDHPLVMIRSPGSKNPGYNVPGSSPAVIGQTGYRLILGPANDFLLWHEWMVWSAL